MRLVTPGLLLVVVAFVACTPSRVAPPVTGGTGAPDDDRRGALGAATAATNAGPSPESREARRCSARR